MTSSLKELLASILLVALGLAVHLNARTIVPRFKTGVDSGLFPEIVSAVLVVTAAVIALSAVRKMRRKSLIADTSDDQPGEFPISQIRVWGAAAVTAVYIAILPLTGFLVATMAFLFAQMCLLAPRGERRPLVFALVAGVTAVAVHLIFVGGFGLLLPRGIF